jgi:hypothetical protein
VRCPRLASIECVLHGFCVPQGFARLAPGSNNLCGAIGMDLHRVSLAGRIFGTAAGWWWTESADPGRNTIGSAVPPSSRTRRSHRLPRACAVARLPLSVAGACEPHRRQPPRPRSRTDAIAACRSLASARASGSCSGRNPRSQPPPRGHKGGHTDVAPLPLGVAAKKWPPQIRSAPERRKPRERRAFEDAPKRTRTSTRLSRTRPSTWRVYQFRHRREGDASIDRPSPLSPCCASPPRCR